MKQQQYRWSAPAAGGVGSTKYAADFSCSTSRPTQSPTTTTTSGEKDIHHATQSKSVAGISRVQQASNGLQYVRRRTRVVERGERGVRATCLVGWQLADAPVPGSSTRSSASECPLVGAQHGQHGDESIADGAGKHKVPGGSEPTCTSTIPRATSATRHTIAFPSLPCITLYACRQRL
jgi:hypothetical protein